MRMHASLLAVIGCCLAIQIVIANELMPIRAQWQGVPRPPSLAALRLASLDDRQLAFRLAARHLQEIGDGNGRISALADYDYFRIAEWLGRLDQLDSRSSFAPTLAAFYVGLVGDGERLRHIVTYLADAAIASPQTRWRYLAHAVYLARHRLGDSELALDLANRLARLDVDDMPLWTRQMPAFVLADTGSHEAAADLMRVLIDERQDIPTGELRLMEQFIDAQDRASLRRRLR